MAPRSLYPVPWTLYPVLVIPALRHDFNARFRPETFRSMLHSLDAIARSGAALRIALLLITRDDRRRLELEQHFLAAHFGAAPARQLDLKRVALLGQHRARLEAA